jgi:hypothetical protein
MEPLPITAASVELGDIGFMKAALGLRFFALAIDYLPLIALEQRGWLMMTTYPEFGE